MEDSKKIKVIWWINKWSPVIKGSQYHRELLQMKKRYIYKDISRDEWKKDITYLKNIKDFVYWRYKGGRSI